MKKMDNTMAVTIVAALMANPFIPMAWGLNSNKIIQDGLQFKVQGFKFNGIVQVVYDYPTDTFTIKFLEDTEDMALVEEINEVYIDQLISVIDDFVEKTENYDEDVEKWLKEFDKAI